MKFFIIPSSKNIIATLRIVTIAISKLTFFVILIIFPWFNSFNKSSSIRKMSLEEIGAATTIIAMINKWEKRKKKRKKHD